MAEEKGSYPNHPDPGPKPTSLGGKGTFTPIGSYTDLDKTPDSVNQKSEYGTGGEIK